MCVCLKMEVYKMIHSVSSVSFRAAEGTLDPEAAARKARLAEAGRYALPMQPVKPKKKHKFLSAVAKLIGAAVVVAGALYAGKRFDVFTKMAAKEGKVVKFLGEKLGVAAEFVDTKIVGGCKNLYEAAKARLASMKKPATPDAPAV